MFRFFEKLVDPYQPYPVSNTPPRQLGAFLREYLLPFKKIFWFLGFFSAVVAAIEIGLIWYLGRLITLLSYTTPATFWAAHKVELISVAVFILTLRPLIQAIDTLLQNNAMLPNVGTLVRYRAHKHVLGNRSAGLRVTLQAALQTASCKPHQPRVRWCFRPLMRSHFQLLI